MNRSMDNLEQLSDSELRYRLQQYGFPNLPITDTTRKILIKKLRNHIKNEKTRLRRDTKFVARYSSDEDSSDIDSKKRKGKFPVTPATAVTSTTHNIKQRNPIFNSNTASNEFLPPPSLLGISKKMTSTTSSAASKSPNSSVYVPPPIISHETDEDSDYSNQKLLKTNVRFNVNASPPSSSTKRTTLTSTSYNAPETWSEQTRYSPLSTDRYSTNTSVAGSDSSYISSASLNGRNTSNDSPYLSDFTRRLLNLRGETIRDSVYNKNNGNRSRLSSQAQQLPHYYHHYQTLSPSSSTVTPDPTEIVHQQPEPSISPSAAFSNLLNRLDEQYGVKQTFIPCILLSTLVIFFAMVALMYVTISPDLVNTINEKTTIYTLCGQNEQQNGDSTALVIPAYNCIEKESINGALELLKIIAPELQNRAERNRCHDKNTPYILSAREAISLVQQKNHHKIDVRKTIKNLENLEYLIEMNPQWKIIHTNSNGNPIKYDELMDLRKTQTNHFAITNPKLPLLCSLYNKLQKFFNFILISVGTLISIGLLYFIYRLIKNYQQSRKETVTYFIDEIISTLMRQASINPERSTIIVNHLRDKLIPLHKRKQLEWAWNEAIKFLEQNESRIQFDCGTHNGEDVKLMKWIDTLCNNSNNLDHHYGNKSSSPFALSSTLLMNHSKKWHSPAFDKTNKIANPPTQCLKIRQMFDKFEANNPNLKQIIQDAILEKVGPSCKIYDIQLDKQTCCVYVRCATVKDAGIVHNEINGWWFDKRLVSIKFLRLERYLNRFPKSLSGPQCLHPSNTQNLSMSQCSKDLNSINDDIEEDDIDEDDDE